LRQLATTLKIKKVKKNWQNLSKKLSKSFQKLSTIGQKVVKKLSKSCQNFVSPGKNQKKVNRPENGNGNKNKKKKIIGIP
jgi:hypothetical protein